MDGRIPRFDSVVCGYLTLTNGASTLAKAGGSRQPSANELDGARYQGKHLAQITAKLIYNQ
jgi:hypothetical protein